jgi:hypothetical protein
MRAGAPIPIQSTDEPAIRGVSAASGDAGQTDTYAGLRRVSSVVVFGWGLRLLEIWRMK